MTLSLYNAPNFSSALPRLAIVFTLLRYYSTYSGHGLLSTNISLHNVSLPLSSPHHILCIVTLSCFGFALLLFIAYFSLHISPSPLS
jgi:hypothetical protein